MLTGSIGDDYLLGGTGNDTVAAGAGFDLVRGGPGNDTLDGSTGVDTLSYTTAAVASASTLTASATGVPTGTAVGSAAGDGTDHVTGFDVVEGSRFADTLRGWVGPDYPARLRRPRLPVGNDGDDVLIGGTGNDNLHSGPGELDRIDGGPGNDTLDGTGGSPVAFFVDAPGPVTVNLAAGTASGDGTDTLAGVTGAFGSPFDDTITGSDAGVIIAGLGGNDTLTGGADVDVIEGGDGSDKVDGAGSFDATSYFTAAGPIVADLATAEVNGQGKDTLLNVESVSGSEFDDQLYGDAGTNLLFGEPGDDLLDAGDGFDFVFGGIGVDTCLNWENDVTTDPTECELPATVAGASSGSRLSGDRPPGQAAPPPRSDAAAAFDQLTRLGEFLGGTR